MYLIPGTPEFLALCLAGWLLLVNGLSLAAFGVDKRRSVAGEWRLSEGFLLRLAFVGGWPGAKLGQVLFRHKTVKRSFRRKLTVIGLVQGAALMALLTPVGPRIGAEAQALTARWLPAAASGEQAEAAPRRIVTHGAPLTNRPPAAEGQPRRFGPGSG